MTSRSGPASRAGRRGEGGAAGWWPRLPASLRPKKGRGEPTAGFAVVDPGSTRLRVLAVRPEEGGPAVVGWGEWPVRPDEDLSQPFEEALSLAESMAQQQPAGWPGADQVVVGLPAWQTRGWAYPVTQKRPVPSREIDERELESILTRAFHLSADRLGAAKGREWVVLDAVPTAFGVDGQGVTDPVGFRGPEFSASVFAAAARQQTVDLWTQLAAQQGFSALTITAASLALAACPSAAQGILLDVGGAHTGVVWWRAGRPIATGSVSVGGQLLTECLVRQWRLSPEKAETIQHSLAAGQLASQVSAQLLGVLRPALGVWRQAVEGQLAEMYDSLVEPLPHRLLICGGGSALPALRDEARALFTSQRLTFGRYPELGALRPTDVPGIANRTETGRAPGQVPALALAAWSARLTAPPARPARILQKLCR